MSEMIISNLRGKLSKTRETCPGFSEEMCIENIKAGKSGAVVPDIGKFPKYFIEHKTQVLAESVHVPKILSAITNENFADEFENEFHNLCREREHYIKSW